MPQIVEPEIREACLSASGREAVFNIRDGRAIPKNIPSLLRHLREDSIEGIIRSEAEKTPLTSFLANNPLSA